MKRICLSALILIYIQILSSNVFCEVGDINLVLDVRGANRYLDLFEYIRLKNNTYFKHDRDELTDQQIEEIISKNKTDTVLTKKINHLLDLPLYQELSSKIKSFNLPIDSIAVYRETFYRLPWKRTFLMGGVDEKMIALMSNLGSDLKTYIITLTDHLADPKTSQKIVGKASAYLPPEMITKENITTFIYFDGNRSSFRKNKDIYFDLCDYYQYSENNLSDYNAIDLTIAHELHHVFYGTWLEDQYFSNEKLEHMDAIIRELMIWQKKLLLEGTARFCDMDRIPELIKI